MKKDFLNSAGFSLVSVLIAVSIVAGLSVVILNQQKTMLKIQSSNEINNSILQHEYRLSSALQTDKYCKSIIGEHSELIERLKTLTEDDLPGAKEEPKVLFGLIEGEGLFYTYEKNGEVVKKSFGEVGKRLSGTKTTVEDIYFTTGDTTSMVNLNMLISKTVTMGEGFDERVVASQYLGSSHKLITIPIYYYISAEGELSCQANNPYDVTYCEGKPGTAFAGFKNGRPDCVPINNKDRELPLTDFDTTVLGEVSTKKVKDEFVNCPQNSIPVGFSQYKAQKGLFKENKVEFSMKCLSNVVAKKVSVDENGEEQTDAYKFDGYDQDIEFQSRVEEGIWGHCPEGQVMYSMKINKKKEMDYSCRHLVFAPESDDVQDVPQCSAEKIDEIKNLIAFYENQRDRIPRPATFGTDGRDDLGSKGREEMEAYNKQKAIYQDNIYAYQQELDKCHVKYVSSKTIKSRTISSVQGEAKCPESMFTTGVISTADNIKFRCSKFTAEKKRYELE
ncbi:MAG: hypothetical protein H6621_02080 [Halobacteriovoraceae bacterium]|nr:hypothetical protein [Halobacteriovoraceae bacterium]MCB9093831.1 hypothetical protein [Halobacteriovoraceae bacterium]